MKIGCPTIVITFFCDKLPVAMFSFKLYHNISCEMKVYIIDQLTSCENGHQILFAMQIIFIDKYRLWSTYNRILSGPSQFLVDSSRRSTISVAPCCSEPHRSYKTCIECRPECSTDLLIKNTSVYAEYIILIRNTFLISVENSIDIYTIQLKILFHNIIQNLSFFKIHINSSVKIHPMIHVLKFISS